MWLIPPLEMNKTYKPKTMARLQRTWSKKCVLFLQKNMSCCQLMFVLLSISDLHFSSKSLLKHVLKQ